jgi:hypothetical protein
MTANLLIPVAEYLRTQDVAGGNTDCDANLVYDVSRWGRFQDADESAHC